MNDTIQERLQAYLLEQGASDVGFSMPPDAGEEFPGLPYAFPTPLWTKSKGSPPTPISTTTAA